MSVPTIGGQGKVIASLGSQALATGDIAGTGGSQKGYHYGLLVVNAGTMPSAGATVKLQESDVVGSGYTDITSATLTYAASTTGTKMAQIRLDGVKKFVRIVANGLAANLGAELIGFPCRDTENYSPDSLEFDVS